MMKLGKRKRTYKKHMVVIVPADEPTRNMYASHCQVKVIEKGDQGKKRLATNRLEDLSSDKCRQGHT
jgi:hypothetical protein